MEMKNVLQWITISKELPVSFREINSYKTATLVATCTLLCAAFSIARAQQNIVNVPTADVPTPCKVNLELGIDAKPNGLERKALRSSQSASPFSPESGPQQSAKQARSGFFPARNM